MATIPNNEIWREFFQIYKDLPELWHVKSEVFKNRNKKRIAWEKLFEKYKEIEPNANIENVKQRINNIRSVFRRELKKIEESTRSGADADELYIPNLWYFEDLEFLRDQELQISGTSTIEIDQAEVSVFPFIIYIVYMYILFLYIYNKH